PGSFEYKPTTPTGQMVERGTAFVPAAMGGGLNTLGGVFRGVVAPATGAETIGDALKGTALEPYGRLLGALTGGALGGLTALPGGADAAVARNLTSAVQNTPDALAKAQALIAKGQQQGFNLTPAEAIDAVTRGTAAGGLLKTAEAMGGSPVSSTFMADRPGQIATVGANLLDKIASPSDAAAVGVQAKNAAEGAIKSGEDALNASTQHLYDASKNTIVPPDAFAPVMNSSFAYALNSLRNDPITGPKFANMPDASIGVIDAVVKRMNAQAKALNNEGAGTAYDPHAAATLFDDANFARLIAGKADPNYAKALEIQAAARSGPLAYTQNSSLGAVADTSKLPGQLEALFPASPNEGSGAAATFQHLGDQNPAVTSALMRQYLATKFAEATQ